MPVVRDYAATDLLSVARASSAWSFNAAGVLAESPPYALRTDFDPATLGFRGLLVESAGANQVANPRLEGAAPTATLPTGMTVNGVTGWSHQIVGVGTEDGMSYLDLRVWSPSSNGNINNYRLNLVPSIAMLTGETWTASVNHRLIAGSMTGFTSLLLMGPGHTVGAATLANPTAAALRTQRATLSRTLAADEASSYLSYSLRTPGPNGSGAGDVTVRIASPALELRTFPTSILLPPAGTPGVSARAADDLALTDIGRWFSAAAGTFVIDFMPGQAASDAERGLLILDDATVSNRIRLRMLAANTNLRLSVDAGGVAVVPALDLASGAALTRHTVRMSYGPAGFLMSVNGGAPVSASGAMPAGLTRVMLGRSFPATHYLDGWIGPRVAFYPVQYTDSAAADGHTIRTR